MGIVLLMFILLSGCSNDPVQKDLLNYVNEELKAAAKFEAAAVSAYESVSGANYKDDQTMYDALVNEVIPNYSNLLNELESVKIETDEVKDVHAIYLEGANIQFKAFEKIKQALEGQDSGMIQEANDMLAQASALISDYQKKLNGLADEHNVTIEK